MVCRAIYKILIFILLFGKFLGAGYAAPYSFIDKRGKRITVDVPVKRAVIIITYELIPALNIWDQVVGVSIWAKRHCDIYRFFITKYPQLEKVAVGQGTSINIETLIKLNPDIVITWTYNLQAIKFMESKNIKVFAIYPDSLSEFYQVLKVHGKLFGKEKRTRCIIEEMNKIFDLIKRRISKIPYLERKKVIHLGGKPTTVSAKYGVTSDLIKIIGGINPADNIKKRNIEVSVERILLWNPDVIFIWGNAGYGPDWIMNNTQWSFVKAVKKHQVFKLPKWSTWSPRATLIALYMAKKVYPKYFKDVNFEKIADDFYKKVFGISYFEVENGKKN